MATPVIVSSSTESASRFQHALRRLGQKPVLLLGLLLAVTLLTRVAYFCVPLLGHDEPTYAAMAARYLNGGLPYADAVDHKPAGISATYAVVFAFAGIYNILAVRLFFVFVIALSGLMLAQLGRRLLDDDRGWLSGLLYVLFACVGIGSHHYPPDTELFLNLPLITAALAVHCALEKPSGLLLLTVAGFLTGLAGFYKYQGAMAGVAWAVAVLYAKRGAHSSLRLLMWRWLALIVGFAVSAALYLGFFAWKGIWSDFLFWGWGFNAKYLSTIELRESAWLLVRALLVMGGSWLPLLLCFLVPHKKHLPGFIWAWLVVMLSVCGLGGRFFYSYFLMALPPLCLLCLPGLLALFDGKKGWIPHQLQIMSVLTCLLCTAFALVAVFWIEIAPNQAVEHKAARAVSDYLAEHSSPSDRVFVWGAAPEIYVYSKRVIGTRFVFCNYHTGKIWGGHLTDVDATGTESHIVPLAWTELLNDLQNNRPLFVVDGARFDRFDRHPVSRYPQLAEVIEQNYSQVALVSGVPIYRRKDQIGSPSVRPSAQP